MKFSHNAPESRTEMLVGKALQMIAELDPSVDALSITDIELLAELYGSDETVRHQAEKIAMEKGITLRTVYRMRLDILGKINKTLPSVLSESEKNRFFERRWQE